MTQARGSVEYTTTTLSSAFLSFLPGNGAVQGTYGGSEQGVISRRNFLSFGAIQDNRLITDRVDAASAGPTADDIVSMLHEMGLGEQIRHAEAELASDIEAMAGEPTLKSLRLWRGLSQAALALELGTTQSRISRLEAGLEEMGISFAARMANSLGVDVNILARAVGVGVRSGL